MFATAVPECQVPDLASFIQQVNIGIFQDGRRLVLCIDRPIYVNTDGKTPHNETKFYRQGGEIFAHHGQASESTKRVVDALGRFVSRPFDRYTGIRILSMFDSPDDNFNNSTKIVIDLLSDGHTAEEVAYAVVKALLRTCFRISFQRLDHDTPSELEVSDRLFDQYVPAYAMSH